MIPCIDLDQASGPGPRTRSACAYRYPETGGIRWPPGRTPGPRPAPGAERSRPPDQARSLGHLEGDVPAMAGRLRADPLRSMKWGYANLWRLLKNSNGENFLKQRFTDRAARNSFFRLLRPMRIIVAPRDLENSFSTASTICRTPQPRKISDLQRPSLCPLMAEGVEELC